MSSTWAYFYTSSDNFIFNKGVYTTANKFSSYDSGDLELQTGGNTKMLIDSATGQVGINTTNPQNTLNVVGDANFTGELYANGNRIDNFNSTGLIANWSEIIDLSDYVPYIGGGSNLNLSGQNISADYFIADGSFLTGISGGSVWDTSGSDIYYNAGNVGINTSSPETTFNVNGDVLIGLAGKIILSHASSSDDDWSIGAEGENLLVREKDDSNKFYMGIYDDANISLGVGGTTLTVTDTEIQIDNTIRFFDPIGTGTDDALLVAYVNNVQGSEYPCVYSGSCIVGSAPSAPSASCGSSYIDSTIIDSQTYSSGAGDGCAGLSFFSCSFGSSNKYINTRTYCKGWKAG